MTVSKKRMGDMKNRRAELANCKIEGYGKVTRADLYRILSDNRAVAIVINLDKLETKVPNIARKIDISITADKSQGRGLLIEIPVEYFTSNSETIMALDRLVIKVDSSFKARLKRKILKPGYNGNSTLKMDMKRDVFELLNQLYGNLISCAVYKTVGKVESNDFVELWDDFNGKYQSLLKEIEKRNK